MIEFEARIAVGRVDARKVAAALERVEKLAEYRQPDGDAEGAGELYRSTLPLRSELLSSSFRGFDAISTKSGATEQHLHQLLPLVKFVQGTWFEDVGDVRLTVSYTDSGCQLGFSNEMLQPDEGYAFIASVVQKLRLPVTLAKDRYEATHTGGLVAQAEGYWSGLMCELPEQNPAAILGYIRELRALVGEPVKETSWAFGPAEGVDASKGYDALAAAALPAKSVTLSYEFVPPDRRVIPAFQGLCAKAKDNFTVPLGTYLVLPGIRAVVEIMINAKGFQPGFMIDTAFAKQEDFPSRKALQAARDELARSLGVPGK